jgi:hypothetical protein
MGVRYSKPPVLIHDVIGNVGAVVSLLESQAPYNPLGGWYNPGADPHARTRPMWFQKDWVHGDFAAEARSGRGSVRRPYAQNHSTNVARLTTRARLRAVAGNQASSRPAPKGLCADRHRTPRRPRSLIV